MTAKDERGRGVEMLTDILSGVHALSLRLSIPIVRQVQLFKLFGSKLRSGQKGAEAVSLSVKGLKTLRQCGGTAVRGVRKSSVLLTKSTKISDAQNQPLAGVLGRRGARGFANAAGAPYGL